MSTIRDAVVVDATPDEVWRVIGDPRNLPRWNRQIRAVAGAPDGELREEDSYRVQLGFLGVSAEVRAVVKRLERPTYSEVALSGPIEGVVRTFVRPIGASRSRVEHEVEYRFRGGALGRAAARAVRLMGASLILRRGLRAQKEMVEGR
ncbi:MAG TPA: SRPBCC family protein [Actinomycetota bacterium]